MIFNNSNTEVKNNREVTYHTEFGIITFGKKSQLHGNVPTSLPNVQLSPIQDKFNTYPKNNSSTGGVAAVAIAFFAWLFGRK